MVLSPRNETNFTSITISWQPLNCLLQNGQITQYSITYTEVGMNRLVESVNQDSDVLMYTANVLNPGTTYQFQVAARNSIGLGPYAAITATTTLPTGILEWYSLNV